MTQPRKRRETEEIVTIFDLIPFVPNIGASITCPDTNVSSDTTSPPVQRLSSSNKVYFFIFQTPPRKLTPAFLTSPAFRRKYTRWTWNRLIGANTRQQLGKSNLGPIMHFQIPELLKMSTPPTCQTSRPEPQATTQHIKTRAMKEHLQLHPAPIPHQQTRQQNHRHAALPTSPIPPLSYVCKYAHHFGTFRISSLFPSTT